MLPVVAIVGRPNVGKSTLFNRLIGYRKAIVQDDPGVTRDRHYATTQIEGRALLFVDTGGLDPGSSGEMDALIREQTQLAIDEADLVLLILDAREGATSVDEQIVTSIRRTGKPILFVANKADGPNQQILSKEFYRLGARRVLDLSAEHGLGFDDLADAILEALPAAPQVPEADSEAKGPLRIALVGRPNAGKSSLLNCLVGEERAIVSPAPGTTRDPIDVRIETPSGPFVIVDTAGIRRKKSASTTMERYASIRALRVISEADVACLVMDATAGVAEQDQKIAAIALDAGRSLLLIFTQADRLTSPSKDRVRLATAVQEELAFVRFAPHLFVSSVTRKGVGQILSASRRIYEAGGLRVSTSELNRFLEETLSSHAPPAFRGRAVRFFYITQPEVHPPTFIASVSHPQGVHDTYRRFLLNRLRERFGFEGNPLRLFLKGRKKKEEDP